ncbi:OmpA family protein [Erythrobacter sp. HL-111]|uniref:OmpA family protein n=1 Tax=Erythrobacter sp. HL-111 TaxID=1798193 RepID=UPI0006DB12EF|nr:OmpA family protein [Erythrobacter sp. HL-111]KPP88363.1 MAG: putative outer membrane protein [Erythrobacteraceae bacterium HL-111]SDS81060.1 Outer membrane protein OmpA [Erythrobacter sp. HL-111]
MAEIPVEKKGGGLGWLWILLGLLAVALLLWLIFANTGDDDGLATADDDMAGTAQTEQAATDEDAEGAAEGGLMTAESVAAANRRSLERMEENPEATPRIFFAYDSADLTDGAREVLDAMVEARPEVREDGITLAGFADRAGPRPYNRELSDARAEQTRDYLVSQGLDGDDIEIEAEGETPTLVETGNDEREVLNRRVRLELGDTE